MRHFSLYRWLPLALAVVLMAGCSGSETGRLTAYFGQTATYEKTMANLQSDMSRVQSLEFSQRAGAYRSLAARAEKARQQLVRLAVPVPARHFQALLVQVFDDFIDFAKTASASYGAKGHDVARMNLQRKRDSQKFRQLLHALATEQERLGQRYHLKFK